MNIAVDVGYSSVKAVSEHGGRVMFPSFIAPATELSLGELSQTSVGHFVRVKPFAGEPLSYFVGELALKEGLEVEFTMEREKYLDRTHDVFLLTAVGLLFSNCKRVADKINIAVGLPISYFAKQKDSLQAHIRNLSAYISVDGSEFQLIEFNEVLVYPQAAGALFKALELPESGLAALIDIGYKTTDYLVVETSPKVRPVSKLSGTIEIGAFNLYSTVAKEYERQTGGTLDWGYLPYVVKEGKVPYRGTVIDLRDTIRSIKAETARVIASRVLAAWKGTADIIQVVYLAGGGALEFGDLVSMLPAAKVLPDPQWANAEGFLSALQAKLQKNSLKAISTSAGT
ncbi:MAG: hypothetical protein XD63_0658 [Thermoanaerobacterales bacterium 50_218]|nr:MAG: hypothetical protein XD63_0658 [Thermoanaerobacterales bacterium 50_218]